MSDLSDKYLDLAKKVSDSLDDSDAGLEIRKCLGGTIDGIAKNLASHDRSNYVDLCDGSDRSNYGIVNAVARKATCKICGCETTYANYLMNNFAMPKHKTKDKICTNIMNDVSVKMHDDGSIGTVLGNNK